MSGARITKARAQKLAAGIKSSALFARKCEPYSRGSVSYAGFCGGLEAILCHLVGELGGEEAQAIVQAAFVEAFDDNTPAAQAVIEAAKAAA